MENYKNSETFVSNIDNFNNNNDEGFFTFDNALCAYENSESEQSFKRDFFIMCASIGVH